MLPDRFSESRSPDWNTDSCQCPSGRQVPGSGKRPEPARSSQGFANPMTYSPGNSPDFEFCLRQHPVFTKTFHKNVVWMPLTSLFEWKDRFFWKTLMIVKYGLMESGKKKPGEFHPVLFTKPCPRFVVGRMIATRSICCKIDCSLCRKSAFERVKTAEIVQKEPFLRLIRFAPSQTIRYPSPKWRSPCPKTVDLADFHYLAPIPPSQVSLHRVPITTFPLLHPADLLGDRFCSDPCPTASNR